MNARARALLRAPRYLVFATVVAIPRPADALAWDAGNPFSQCKNSDCSGGVKRAQLSWASVVTGLGASRVADCPAGYTNNGLTCGRGTDNMSAPSRVADCPSGWTNMGLYCGRGLSTRGPSSMSCPSGYFINRSLGRCYKECPSGYTNTGEFCFRSASTLGLSSMSCRSDERFDSGRCYAVPNVALRGNTHLWIVNQALTLLRGYNDPVAQRALARMSGSGGCLSAWQNGLYDGDEPALSDSPDKETRGTHFYNPLAKDAYGNNTSARTYIVAGVDVTLTTEGKFNPNARDHAANRIGRSNALLSNDDACYQLGVALHYMTDMTQPMHASSFSGASAPLFLHPYFEAYVPRLHSSAQATGMWSGRWKGSTPDATFHEVAVRSNSLAPALVRALLNSGGACTMDGVEIPAPYTGPCFIDNAAVDGQIRAVLHDAYQSTASYIYNVFNALSNGAAPVDPVSPVNPTPINPTTPVAPTSLGPAGGAGGAPFSDSCDIGEIRVRAGAWIDAVQVVCRDGRALPNRGGSGGSVVSFALQPGEQLRAISGSTHGGDGDFVYSLQLHTDRRSSSVYGGPGTRPFRLEAPPGTWVIGLTGRAGAYLDAIGALAASSR